jgi:hypothetical protein
VKLNPAVVLKILKASFWEMNVKFNTQCSQQQVDLLWQGDMAACTFPMATGYLLHWHLSEAIEIPFDE